MKNLSYLVLLISILHCTPKDVQSTIFFPGKPAVPVSIEKTHAAILAELQAISSSQNSTSKIVLKLEALMTHHFKEEEQIILPTLGLLPALSRGESPAAREEIILFTDHSRSQMDHLSAEHQLIKAYIEELKQASTKEHLAAILKFENEVSQHAITEEEVFFPAALLVGEYLKLKAPDKP